MKYLKEDKNLAFIFNNKRVDLCAIKFCDTNLFSASGGYYNCIWTDNLDILNISNMKLKKICKSSKKDFGVNKLICKNKFNEEVKKYNKKFRNEIIDKKEYFIYEF